MAVWYFPCARFVTNRGFVWRPVARLEFEGVDSRLLFIVDTGADVSLAPRDLAELTGLDWESGQLLKLTGISQREECSVRGRVHEVPVSITGEGKSRTIPICIAEGQAPMLLGRTGFIPPVQLLIDGERRLTRFESR